MMIPGFIYLFINNYLPMAGLVVAFKQYDARKGIFGSDFIGFQNFKYLFATKDALVITRNTLLYNAAFIVLNTVLSIFIAILLSELFSIGARKLYQSVILLPFLISTVIAGYIVYGFLSADSGFINKSVLPLLGIDDISWYNEPKYWPVVITFVYIWKNVGYNCIIYLSAIIGIDRQYYEAAALEGAGKIRQIFSITLPMIKSVTIMLILLAIGRIFYADFGLFYQVPMNSGALFPTTNVIDTYVYRSLIQIGNIGMSSAAGFYQSIVGLVLVSVSNLVIRKVDPESALF
ncbi:sugar ABC transporter permease [Acutalibacter muris]|uniref:Sugar ABC transporter permease n=2 Tax=Acutalibacter muris TaxID=1796620 RepID=A0A1Z2XWE2_9FIRM|nr:ABC transporter permease subunit [Acutalibacter muris]ANU56122.1 sugar ABC transporter permease [Hungateiclostridiaceae bacterium KB18]ASB42750.1 sugar ABC transporter permease [Acutalibacter muris]QQR30570.1 sugar ABC transporter permease [Acutalibacter muris]